MALKLKQKKTIVAEVSEVANHALSVVAVEYRGLTVSEMNQLRNKARKDNVLLRVVPNTLARRAFSSTTFECMQDSLVGPLMLAFAQKELSASARLIKDFKKTNEKLVVKAISLDGKLFGAEHLNAVAALPTKDEAIAQLLSVMQAPIATFVRIMAAPHTKLVRTLAAIRDQKQLAA